MKSNSVHCIHERKNYKDCRRNHNPKNRDNHVTELVRIMKGSVENDTKVNLKLFIKIIKSSQQEEKEA